MTGDAVETAELSANGRTVHIEAYCEDKPVCTLSWVFRFVRVDTIWA